MGYYMYMKGFWGWGISDRQVVRLKGSKIVLEQLVSDMKILEIKS